MSPTSRVLGHAVRLSGLALLSVAAFSQGTIALAETAGRAPAHTTAIGGGDRVPKSGLERGVRGHGVSAVRIDLEGLATVSGDTSAASRGAATPVRISGTPMAGSVSAFAVAPGGATAVYIADQQTVGLFELYSTPVDGSAAAIRISSGLVFGGGDEGVSAFSITPDGAAVVFLADAINGGGDDDLYSVPIDGSAAPVQLNAGTDAPVTGFGISPDGTRVAFLGADTVAGAATVEVHVASVGVAGSAVQLSQVAASNAGGEVVAAEFVPGGQTLIFAADGTTVDDVFQWYGVPLAATGPGSELQLSAALGSVGGVSPAPDGATVAYVGDDAIAGVDDVMTVPIGGGAAVRLNPPVAGSGARAIEFSPSGDRVGYLADQDTAGVVEVYSAQAGVADSGVRLSTPMSGTQLADTLNVSPDGTTVLYQADQNTPGTVELFGVPIDGSAAPTTLHGLSAPDNIGFFIGLGTPVIGRRAVYPVIGADVRLFSVPFDGSEPFVEVNDPLAAGDTVFNAFLPGSATRLVAFGVGADTDSVTEQIWVAAVRGDLPQQQVNVTAAAGRFGVLGYEIGSDESYAVYLQDQNTAGKPELYATPLDSDGDAVPNPVDSCPFHSNPGQADVIFDQTVLATGPDSFGWGAPAEVRFVRGPLDGVDALTFDDAGTLADALSFVDAARPATGAGFYYVFAPDCAGRSYQTATGAEPARDVTLP
jgi:Tol biopolymer transport system component